MSKVLFAFDRSGESYGDWINFWATTEEYWLTEGCFDDCFREDNLGVDIPGVANTMEAAFEVNPTIGGKTEDEVKAYLESFGLVYSESMQKKLEDWA